jgi:hypothetical protein
LNGRPSGNSTNDKVILTRSIYGRGSDAMRLAYPSTLAIVLMLLTAGMAAAHAVAEGHKGCSRKSPASTSSPSSISEPRDDHLLFLFGAIFLPNRLKHIAIHVSLFAIGHSTSMLLGVHFGSNVSAYLIDAIIGLSVVIRRSTIPEPSRSGSAISPTPSSRP